MENKWTREIERLREEKRGLLKALKESLRWFGKLAADHEGDHIAEAVMRHYARIETVIKRAKGGE